MSTPEMPYTTSVDDIRVEKARGPWKSKSGADLMVRLALSRGELEAFLDFDNPEFTRVEEESGVDIRGFRTYTVSDIPAGSIGGKEWHVARTEGVAAMAGRALWQCVDLSGRKREFVLENGTMVVQPPGIFHTYTALEDGTTLQVVCNTLFVPEDPRTHDTYFGDTFVPLRTSN